ncbi:hypothetical protein EON65_27980 [archaeon]|nr:MAG: hypothetical protein EON65_27980 [archaeon]
MTLSLTTCGPEEFERLKLVMLPSAELVLILCEELDKGEMGDGARLSINTLSSGLLKQFAST